MSKSATQSKIYGPQCMTKYPFNLCYGHKSSTGTVRRLFHHLSILLRPVWRQDELYDFYQCLRHRTIPGDV